MLLVIDNFDSFTHNLLDYFSRLGIAYQLYRNDVPLEEIQKQEYTGLVISPGPETPERAGRLMEILAHYIDKLPILGICLGHQAIGQYFGASLHKAEKPMHGKVSIIHLEAHPVFEGLPQQMEVVRYHSLVLDDLPESLHCIARCENGEIMAIAHSSLPILGLQFHPEAWLTRYGMDILQAWYEHFISTRSHLTTKPLAGH